MWAHRAVGTRVFARRAVVAVQVAVLFSVLVGFAALVIDVGAMYNVRADLQRTADASALAGASIYTSDDMMRIRMGTADSSLLGTIILTGQDRATQYSLVNPSLGTTTTYVSTQDLVAGWLNLASSTGPIQTNPQPRDFNAMGVTVRRQGADAPGGNPTIELFFAPIFGRGETETAASAIAVFDDRFSGYSAGGGTGALPFTIHEDAFDSELDAGGDRYGYDGGGVTEGADGIREVRLYPYPLSGSGYSEGDGNFGVLNIGTGNQGLQALRDQIANGVTAADLEMEIGTSDPTFHDEFGNAVTYDITGSPGLDGGLTAAIESMVGEVVGFFLHDRVILSGSNAIYTITEIRFGRLMDIRLTGPPDQRGLYIQPVSYSGDDVHIDPNAPSTGGLVGRVILAR